MAFTAACTTASAPSGNQVLPDVVSLLKREAYGARRTNAFSDDTFIAKGWHLRCFTGVASKEALRLERYDDLQKWDHQEEWIASLCSDIETESSLHHCNTPSQNPSCTFT